MIEIIKWKKLSANNGDSYKGYVGGLNICDILGLPDEYLLSFYDTGMLPFKSLEEAKAKGEELFKEWKTKAEIPTLTMDYEEIIKAMENAPLTQVPAIMIKAIELALKREVFVDDEALKKVVNRVINNNKSRRRRK